MQYQINKPSQASEHRKWQAHLAAQAKSGLNRAEYCRRQHISYHAFAYWQKKFGKPSGKDVTLVPITVQTVPDRAARSGVSADLSIILPGNIAIAVSDNFSGATLNRLLKVLEGR